MKMRKGFTLVELLIVVIIIGILAAAMLLSTGSATDNATATKIVGNLRSIKAAVLMYRSENQGAMPAVTTDTDGGLSVLKKYFGGADFSSQYKLANITPTGGSTGVYVMYTDAAEMTGAVQTQMANLALKNKSILDADGATYESGTSVTMIVD